MLTKDRSEREREPQRSSIDSEQTNHAGLPFHVRVGEHDRIQVSNLCSGNRPI